VSEHNRGVLLSGRSVHWNTPYSVINPLVTHLGTIALDPCSNGTSVIPAKVKWEVEDDGLDPLRSWTKVCQEFEGFALVNPPYGAKNVRPWIARCRSEALQGCEVVLLHKGDIRTQAFHVAANGSRLWAAPRGGLKFLDGGEERAAATFGSSINYWGPRPHLFVRAAHQASWSVFGRVDVTGRKLDH
jgi:hypothetical protein